jgi:hypothetical protein
MNCSVSDLPTEMCTHCRGEADTGRFDNLKINRLFSASFESRCVIEDSHLIVTRDKVSYVGLLGETSDKSIGVACKACTKIITSVA